MNLSIVIGKLDTNIMKMLEVNFQQGFPLRFDDFQVFQVPEATSVNSLNCSNFWMQNFPKSIRELKRARKTNKIKKLMTKNHLKQVFIKYLVLNSKVPMFPTNVGTSGVN